VFFIEIKAFTKDLHDTLLNSSLFLAKMPTFLSAPTLVSVPSFSKGNYRRIAGDSFNAN